MDFDFEGIDLDFLNHAEEEGGIGCDEHRNWPQSQGFADNNAGFETPTLTQPILPISPPNSCPVTPTSIEAVKQPEFSQNFLTDAPELEHYLRQTNPLQGKDLKRKCHWLNEKAETDVKKTKIHEQYKSTDCGESSTSQKTIKWSDYRNEECYQLFTSSVTAPKTPTLLVTCDKGLTFSLAESVFICQKKNHFQISLNLEISADSQTVVQVKDAFQPVICYKVHLYAIKAESAQKKITMEQSTADRSKRPYTPVRFPGGSCGTKTLTIGRLHFSETTSNNMRKKGKLNPDQRYFQLVVDIRAYTKQGNYPICCQVSDKVIVRASNPGQFENDVALWSKDRSGECVYRMGHVGINNDKPDQCLAVNGNIRLTGQIMTPADIRFTEHIHQANTRENLENVTNMKLYRYCHNKHYLNYAGLSVERPTEDLGVLANELKTLIPDAVTEGADIVLPEGKLVKDVLMINKDRLLMESLGAIQELSNLTNILTSRMLELETKTEILEVVLKNMVSESINIPSLPI